MIRLPDGAYRLASLSESLRLEVPEGSEPLVDAVMPLLERGATASQLKRAAGRGNGAKVDELLAGLERSGMLEPDTGTGGDGHDAARDQLRFFANFRALGVAPAVAEAAPTGLEMQERLSRARVARVGLGAAGSRLEEELAACGVGSLVRVDAGELSAGAGAWPGELAQADIVVLCEDRFDPETYRRVNEACLERRTIWTSFRDLGSRFEIGPTVIPYESACWRCYALRRASNDDDHELWTETASALAADGRSLGSLNARPGPSLLAVEVVKLLTGFSRPISRGALLSFDLLRFEARVHPVLKIPRCAACGAAARGQAPWRIWRLEPPAPT